MRFLSASLTLTNRLSSRTTLFVALVLQIAVQQEDSDEARAAQGAFLAAVGFKPGAVQ